MSDEEPEEMIVDNEDDVEMVGNEEDENDSEFEDIEDDDEGGEGAGEGGAETSGTTTGAGEAKKKKKKKKSKKGSTYLPGMQMQDGETLVCEESAYIALHTFTTTSPCLSFDIIPDSLGYDRSKFPLTAYSVSGTQAQRSHANNLLVMKVSQALFYFWFRFRSM